MDRRFTVDGIELAAHLSRPVQLHDKAQPGLVIAHGFPAEAGGGINSTASFPEFADRVATELAPLGLDAKPLATGIGCLDRGARQFARTNPAVSSVRNSGREAIRKAAPKRPCTSNVCACRRRRTTSTESGATTINDSARANSPRLKS